MGHLFFNRHRQIIIACCDGGCDGCRRVEGGSYGSDSDGCHAGGCGGGVLMMMRRKGWKRKKKNRRG